MAMIDPLNPDTSGVPLVPPPPTDATNADNLAQMLAADQQSGDTVNRDPPDPPERRERLVNAWCARVKQAKSHWKKAFDRMQEDEDFAFGQQWSKNPDDKRYVANLTLRMCAQKTAFLYAKNPKDAERRRERIDANVMNETNTELQTLIQSGAMM